MGALATIGEHGVERRQYAACGRVRVANANNYDSFAEAYTAETEANLINGYYMRPAILDLSGDVAGRRILDAGCGSGPIAAAVRDRGATVAGFDFSAGMLELARKRLGPDTDLRVADLGSPLPIPRRRVRRRHRGPALASSRSGGVEDGWRATARRVRRTATAAGSIMPGP
jgi:SAM-dependent methyltransferase